MEPKRFDHLTRTIAGRTSRRQALRGLGGGGLAAAMLGAVGLGSARAVQPTPTPPITSNASGPGDQTVPACRRAFSLIVAAGPNAGFALDGALTYAVSGDGRIDGGQLATSDGQTYAVIGQQIGRAVSLRIDLGQEKRLALWGVANDDVLPCRTRLDGGAAGPDRGDVGTWAAAPLPRTGGSATPGAGQATATVGAVANGTGGGATTDTGGGGMISPETPTPGPTPTPCPPLDCGVTFVLDPTTCQCVCPPPSDRCGNVCCFGGSTCDAANNSCACPAGTEPCQEVCTPSCPAGQTLNPTTCQCDQGCAAGQVLCNGACAGPCDANQVLNTQTCQCVGQCPPGQALCNGLCILVTSDPANCGACGIACPTGIPCIAGTCTCPPGYSVCATGCKDLTTDGSNCGTCGTACGTSQTCQNGICA